MTIHAIIELDFTATDPVYDQVLTALIAEGYEDANLFPSGRIPLGTHSLISGSFPEDKLGSIENVDRVAGIFDDPELMPFAPAAMNTDQRTSKSRAAEIGHALMESLWKAGEQGQGVRIAVCDSGIDKNPAQGLLPKALHGFSASTNFSVGEDIAPVPHGTMVAYDALAMAPLAEVVDVGLLKLTGTAPTSHWRLSVAIAAYNWLIADFTKAVAANEPYPLVLCNSWGMRDPEVEWNIGHYATDPSHPFTRLVVEAIDRGILVVFAAGNCGSNDGNPYSPAPFSGPGKSIWGANGHPRVITVGAVDWDRNWMGYSSEGPSSLAPFRIKPDVCGFSQFSGYLDVLRGDDFYPDAGTSAAAPIVAGGLAVLKGKYKQLTQDVAANVLRATAEHPDSVQGAPVVDNRYGWGVVNFEKADQLLSKIYP